MRPDTSKAASSAPTQCLMGSSSADAASVSHTVRCSCSPSKILPCHSLLSCVLSEYFQNYAPPSGAITTIFKFLQCSNCREIGQICQQPHHAAECFRVMVNTSKSGSAVGWSRRSVFQTRAMIIGRLSPLVGALNKNAHRSARWRIGGR